MAAKSRRTTASVRQQLTDEPYRFDFFQAVLLLERWALERAAEGQLSAVGAVGYDETPSSEAVRFRALLSLSFPPSSVSAIEPPRADGRLPSPASVTAPFLGLIGPLGALPRHYTSLVIERCHVRNKDFAMRDFFDLFNHRALSFFFRGWEKYRLPFVYQRFRNQPADARGGQDPITFLLLCLVGLGTSGLQRRSEFDDQAVVYYAGHFAQRPRSAAALEAVLNDYFQLPIKVRQFVGQWLHLSLADRSALPSLAQRRGQNCELGRSAVAGAKVWTVQSKFRVIVGPVRAGVFRSLLPSERELKKLCQMVRQFVGVEFDFDIQVIVQAAEVPATQLGGARGANAARLGWNCWSLAAEAAQDADQAIFRAIC